MASPRALVGLLLTAAAAAVLATAVAHSYAGPGPAPIVSAPLHCPDAPANLAGQHIAAGSPLPQDLTCANLRGTVLDGIDLSQASLVGADAEGASFRHANLEQADLSAADLRGAHLDGADLSQATMVGTDAEGASFSGDDMSQLEASGIRLRRAYLDSVDLTQATLRDADMRDADLNFASLTQATMDRADLRGASLWITGSIQTGTGSVRIGAVEPGVVQLPYLAGLLFLVLMVRRLIRVLRLDPDRPAPPLAAGRLLTGLAVTAGVFAAGAALASLILGELLSVWLVDPLLPWAAVGVMLVLSATVSAMGRPPGPGVPPGSPLAMRRLRMTGRLGSDGS